MPADNPTLSTISSTSLSKTNSNQKDAKKIELKIMPTYPLQLIKVPIEFASRQLNPANLAAMVQPPNLPVNARLQIAIVNAQVMPGNRCVNVRYQVATRQTIIE